MCSLPFLLERHVAPTDAWTEPYRDPMIRCDALTLMAQRSRTIHAGPCPEHDPRKQSNPVSDVSEEAARTTAFDCHNHGRPLISHYGCCSCGSDMCFPHTQQ